MYDQELCLEILRQIEGAAIKIGDRFQVIHQPSDFTDNPAGVEKMDSICMMLIVIGESLKNLEKVTGGKLLAKYPQIDWKKAMGMRDIITHHYADLHADTIFFTCQRKIPPLLETVRKMTRDLR